MVIRKTFSVLGPKTQEESLSRSCRQLAFFLPARRSDKNNVCMNLFSWQQKLRAVARSL
ncbi:hypothetical protein SLEP1_g7326 [Rubroshorea leprosula]|uniref:Uncharacterized protein n=1 Tax=Rubroshorea leprosula TaxID=152421 RepID=A0AAV5HY13_9ROSI|nr:hypothetical protein SLEP1_g7326 [Rubroshorea leprosula]